VSDAAGGLTDFQLEVARLFFDLPQSAGFLLAGGAALIAQELTPRATQDLDFFTSAGRGDVASARDGLEQVARDRGWTLRRVREAPTFCRLVVVGPEEELLVDLAVDSPPGLPPVVSLAGPTYDPEELAGRKVIALFDRAEARDFVDVYALAHRYGKPLLLDRAAQVDVGFDVQVFSQMLQSLDRFEDSDVPCADVGTLRRFFAAWGDELRSR
jgi:hypothetical protein